MASIRIPRWNLAPIAAIVAGALLHPPARALAASSTAQFEQRRQEVLSTLVGKGPLLRECVGDDLRGSCNVQRSLAFSLGALYSRTNDQVIGAGNAAIRSSIDVLFTTLRGKHARVNDNVFSNSFLIPLSLLDRAYFLFGDAGVKQAGLLAQDNQKRIRELVWEYSKPRCAVADANIHDTWKVYGSENLHLLHVAVCWAAAEIMAGGDARQYDDGSSPVTQRSAWNEYLKEYIRQRARYGGLIEFFSQYYKYTLLNIHNFGEFSSDSRLRQLSLSFLDVWFADWAEEQIGGIHGGAKARLYFDLAGRTPVGAELGWLYFGLGEMQPDILHPTFVSMITSSYKPPELVAQIATDIGGRGKYEALSRRPGLLDRSAQAGAMRLDAAKGGILRYTYVTPSFVMGTSLFAKYPAKDWSPASAQNRWNGLVLSGSPQRYLFASPVNINAAGRTTNIYNSEWGVQHKGTQIIQKLTPPFSGRSGSMTIWIGNDLTPERDGDWIFFKSSAYVAIRSVFGSLIDRPGVPRGYVLSEDLSPVILCAASPSEFQSFADFKRAVASSPMTVNEQSVQFRSPGDEATIRFFYKSDRLPEIDGAPVNLTPPYSFDSPFIRAQWGEGVITIQNGDEKIVRDFRN